MTKTTNYQLNQWAKSDRIRMDDFNADNAKIDAALKANADAIAETVAAFPLVKIKEVTLGSSTAAYTLDVSDVDFTQYYSIELFCDAASISGGISLQVNGITSGYCQGNASGGGSGYDSTTANMGLLGGKMMFYQPAAGAYVGCCYFWGSSSNSFSGYQYVAPCTWDNLTSFNLTRKSGIPEGTKITLLGIRK